MSKNDVTGDALRTKTTSDAYRDGYANIWGYTCQRCGKKGLKADSVHTCSPKVWSDNGKEPLSES